MAKKQDSQPQQTMEDYLLAQLNEEVILKDGTQLKAADSELCSPEHLRSARSLRAKETTN